MQTEVATHIDIRPDRDGHNRAYIVGTRTRVQDIYVLAEIQGLTPDQIVEQLPHLTLGQVHASLSYYFDHREQIRQQLQNDQAFIARMRTDSGAGPLEQRLGAARGDDAVSS